MDQIITNIGYSEGVETAEKQLKLRSQLTLTGYKGNIFPYLRENLLWETFDAMALLVPGMALMEIYLVRLVFGFGEIETFHFGENLESKIKTWFTPLRFVLEILRLHLKLNLSWNSS